MLAGREYYMDIMLSKNGVKCVLFKISDVQILFNIISTIYGSNIYDGGALVSPKGSSPLLHFKPHNIANHCLLLKISYISFIFNNVSSSIHQ